MKRYHLVIAAAAAGLALTGCMSQHAPKTASQQAAADAAASSGQVQLLDYSINSDGPSSSVIVTGAIGDYGQGVTVYPDGKVDPDHSSELELNLRHGSFRLMLAGIDKEIVSAYQHFPANPVTCSGSITISGHAPVVAGAGTGAYRGMTGSIELTVTLDEIDTKPVCNGTSPFIAQVIVIRGSGTVSADQGRLSSGG